MTRPHACNILFPSRRSSDLLGESAERPTAGRGPEPHGAFVAGGGEAFAVGAEGQRLDSTLVHQGRADGPARRHLPESRRPVPRSEEHTSELQSLTNIVCLLL